LQSRSEAARVQIPKNSSTTTKEALQFRTNCWNTGDFEFTGEF
jgi:hypothetical protein